LANLGDVARAVADAMADVHGDTWTRSGRGPNGTISALEIARLGVAISVDHLRAAEQLINP
jgi:fructose-1,6-bisphosphatase/sedoheptulose 1,7-bisphosphatase-like protein